MKKIFLLLCLITAVSAVKSQGIYFQAQVKKSISGTSLEFYIRPNPAGSNINLKFDNLDFFIRWPSSEVAPTTGTPVVNTTDFPGLSIIQQSMDNSYGTEAGFVNREWTSPTLSSTNTAVTYVAGQEYLVFSVPVSNTISNNLVMAGNNESGALYIFAATKNTTGIGGQSDHTSHNSINGNVNNQLFYGSSASLSEMTTVDGTKNFYQQITAGSVLPVKFTSFNAVKKNDNAALNWAVENETVSVDHYEIERSLNGTTFNKINSFLKSNNLNNGNTYNYLDQNISTLKSNGIIYYRIKQIDIDGRFVYSEIRKVKTSEMSSFIAVYPNPVKDITSLQIDTQTNMQVQFSLLSNDGRMIQKNTIQAVKGINMENISMKNFAAGNYLLKVEMGNNVQTLKIIKE